MDIATILGIVIAIATGTNEYQQGIVLGTAPFLQKPLTREAVVTTIASALAALAMHWDETAGGGTAKEVQWVD